MQKSPVDILRAAGEALFGDEWQSPLARTLSIDGRKMRFYVAGDRPVPEAVLDRLPEILRQTAVDRRRDADYLEHLAADLA